jgi:hypothetical protein
MQELRFVCLREPTETWAVWDERSGGPAVDPMPLTGLTEQAAEAACFMLNRRDRMRTGRQAIVVPKLS